MCHGNITCIHHAFSGKRLRRVSHRFAEGKMWAQITLSTCKSSVQNRENQKNCQQSQDSATAQRYPLGRDRANAYSFLPAAKRSVTMQECEGAATHHIPRYT